MTGRDLILYILSNGLENEPVVKDGKLIGFMTVEETAAKMNVGAATVLVWIRQNRLQCIAIGNVINVPADAKSPIE